MIKFKKHLLKNNSTIKNALIQLDILAKDAILFIIDDLGRLMGSLTDGDVRRGLINGINTDDIVTKIIQPNPKSILKSNYNLQEIINLRNKNYRVLPIIDNDGIVVDVINFRIIKSYLPLDAVIIAGGKGTRLRPLTNDIPKPLLRIADKPIMEHNVDRLSKFGIDNFWFSIKYLGDQIVDYFGDGKDKNCSIQYVWEDEPLGTIGSVSKIDNFGHKHILVSNSDILTNLDYEAFYMDFIEKDADFSVVTIPYNVTIPYAVLETSNGHVLDFKEKPTYTYYSNGGIYLIKRSVLEYIPKDTHFNATDLMEKLITANKKVISYPLVGYWLDVGKHEDFEKAQNDINTIKF